MSELSSILDYLANPASHALTLVLGAALYHYIFARPLRDQHERLQRHVEELFDLQKEALERIGRYGPTSVPIRGARDEPGTGTA